MTIKIPEWAKIGRSILVRDANCKRGDDPNKWYTEKIIAYGDDGIFHQSHNCPVYYTRFSDFDANIKIAKDAEEEDENDD